MELNVLERLVLLSILPKEADFTTVKIIRKLKEDLSFSEEEHKALQFVQDGGNVNWQKDGDIPKDIKIGEKATDAIVEALKKLNTDKKLTEQHLSLYEKFIEK